MKWKMYSIKDELQGFTTPIPMANDDMAKRYFREQQKVNTTISNEPGDFSIWSMGEFDTETGIYEQMADYPKLIERGVKHD